MRHIPYMYTNKLLRLARRRGTQSISQPIAVSSLEPPISAIIFHITHRRASIRLSRLRSSDKMKSFRTASRSAPPPEYQQLPNHEKGIDLVNREPARQAPITAEALARRRLDQIHCVHCGPLGSCDGWDCYIPRVILPWAAGY
jgi:hypothetical protein